MKLFYTILAAALLFTACKKEIIIEKGTADPTSGNLNVTMKNMVGTEDLVLSDLRYTNAAGNLYSINLLKYYMSNVVLHKKRGGNVNVSIYKLIDASNLSTCTFSLGNFDADEYDSISFGLGIDQGRNHTGAQDGDLDVSKGMYWTWNTGYIFYKHEGQFKNSANQLKSLIFHLGTVAAYSVVKLPINLTINGKKTMELKFDVNSAHTSPVNIDFNNDNNRQSSSSADMPWISNMKSNLSDAFSFIRVL
jgi:hypothetical protein